MPRFAEKMQFKDPLKKSDFPGFRHGIFRMILSSEICQNLQTDVSYVSSVFGDEFAFEPSSFYLPFLVLLLLMLLVLLVLLAGWQKVS